MHHIIYMHTLSFEFSENIKNKIDNPTKKFYIVFMPLLAAFILFLTGLEELQLKSIVHYTPNTPYGERQAKCDT